MAAAISRLRRAVVEAPAQQVGLLVGQPAEQVGEAPALDELVDDVS